MATKGIKFAEQINYSANKEVKDGVYTSANFEARTPLKNGVNYVLIAQNNFAAKYVINKREFTGARFYIVELDPENKPVEIRSLSASSLMGTYVTLITDPEAAMPTWPTKVTDHGLRADVQYARTMPCGTTSFLKGVEIGGAKRLQITKPVMFKILRQGACAVPAYEETENKFGFHDVVTNDDGKAVAAKQTMYTFSDVEDVPAKVVTAVTTALKASDLQDLDVL
jgi:hypothetical protein